MFPCEKQGSSNGNLDQSCYDHRAGTNLCPVTLNDSYGPRLGIICLSNFF